MDNDQESTEEPEESVITVRLSGLEDIAPQYVNLVHANNDREIFQVIFSQVTPPIIMGPEDSAELVRRGTIPGKVIARVILTPTVLEQTIDVLQTQFRRYREAQERSETSATESMDD